MKNIVAALAVGCIASVVGAAGFDGKSLTTNDWFDASFTALTADTVIAQGDTTGITRGAGSWTAVPATGTAVIAADADAGGEATLLAISAPDEELTFTPEALAATSGLETVSAEIKADAIDELPALGADVQAAFTVYLDGNGVLSAQGWTAAGWTNLASAAADSLTNAWFTLYADFAKEGGVRYVRYSVKPASGALAVLADADGTTWFQAGRNADVVSSMSFSGIGSVRSFSGDELEVVGVATYNGAAYQTFEAAIAAGVADGWAHGNVLLLADATWTPTATGAYNIDVNGYELTINGVNGTWSGTTYTVPATHWYWIGGASSEWANGANWSHFAGGSAADAYPNSELDSAFFPVGATINLSNKIATVSKIFTDGELTLLGDSTGNSRVRTSPSSNNGKLYMGGTGNVRLAGVALYASYATSSSGGVNEITNNLEIVSGTTNEIRLATGDIRYTSIYVRGALSGGGTLVVWSNTDSGNYQAYFYGDASAFTGVLADHRESDDNAARLNFMTAVSLGSRATYNLAATYSGGGMNYVLRAGGTGTTYQMGALNGEVHFDGNRTDNSQQYYGYTLEIGGKNENCSFGGTLARNGYTSYTKKVGTADMAFTGSQIPNITIENGTYIVGAATALPGSMIFTGGAFSVADGVSVDPVSKFASDSTEAVVFDDRGIDNTWTGGLTDACVPFGFTKKGAGTLTLTTVPTHTTKTTIEDGILVVPQGTTIAQLSCAGGKLTVPLAGTEDETTVLNITALTEGTDYDMLTNAVAIPGTTVAVESDGGSGYIVKATRTPQTFTWTGAVDTDWATPGNWSVGGVVAESLPIAVDTVLFPASESTWEVSLAADAVASNVVFESDTEISAGSFKLTTVEISGAGTLTAKGLKLVSPSNEHLAIRAPIEIPVGYVFETATGTQYKHVYLYSKVTGSGEWKMNQNNNNQRAAVQFHGDLGADMSEFAGTLTVINATSSIRDQTGIWGSIASSSNAVWNLVGFSKTGDDTSSLLKNAGTTYYFGALNATNVCASGNQSNHNKNIWEIGAREDVDSVLSGNFFCNTYTNLVGDRSDTIRKVGAGSTLTFSGSRVRAYEVNAGVLKIGADVSLLTTWDGGSYAPSIAFNGGTLKLSDAVTLDVSTNIAKVASTSAVAFDDEGVDRTWNVALPGSGGLTKKGAGTLTLSEAPLYTGLTTVEEGTLVVPSGSDITYNPFSAGTLSGITPSKFGYPAGTTLTGAETAKSFDGSLNISNVTAIDASAATLVPGQEYVIASANTIKGYNKASLKDIALTLPDGVDASKWKLSVRTIGGKRCLCLADFDMGSMLILH